MKNDLSNAELSRLIKLNADYQTAVNFLKKELSFAFTVPKIDVVEPSYGYTTWDSWISDNTDVVTGFKSLIARTITNHSKEILKMAIDDLEKEAIALKKHVIAEAQANIKACANYRCRIVKWFWGCCARFNGYILFFA